MTEPTASDDDWALPPRTNEPYDAPAAGALIEAVRAYLADDLMPRSSGADRWVLRVAANALSIAAREVDLGAGHRHAHAERLARFGATDDAELSALIRSGALDDRWDEVKAAVEATVSDKLDVASPAHRVG
jgi:hypothetical protein